MTPTLSISVLPDQLWFSRILYRVLHGARHLWALQRHLPAVELSEYGNGGPSGQLFRRC